MNIAALLAGLFSGIIGAMGMGGGAVLIIYLAVFTSTEQLTAQGINLIFFIPIAVLSIIIYAKKGKIEWKTVIPIALGGLIGAALGGYLTTLIKPDLIAKLFGGFLILLGIREFFSAFANNSVAKREKK